jgi:ligand-binding SRPBCC domain-containing protein
MSPIFRHEQVVGAPPERVVAFFHDVGNLPRVSPPVPVLEILSSDTRIRAGAVFAVRLRLGPFHRTLSTRVVRVEPDGSFSDSLEGGPFTCWDHTHRFEPAGNGTRIVDEIAYTARPWIGPLAGLALRILFFHRRRAIQQVLG